MWAIVVYCSDPTEIESVIVADELADAVDRATLLAADYGFFDAEDDNEEEKANRDIRHDMFITSECMRPKDGPLRIIRLLRAWR